jgi:hypothetical protein
MICNIISDINEILLFIYTKSIQLRINCKKGKMRKTELNWLNWNFSIEFSTHQLKIFTRHRRADERIFQALYIF